MLVILKRDADEITVQAAQLIASAIRKKPTLTLGLATGRTMVGVYWELVRLHKSGSLDFSRVVTFNLDEYRGLAPTRAQSFHHFMGEHFFVHVNVDPRNIHIPDGTIADKEEYGDDGKQVDAGEQSQEAQKKHSRDGRGCRAHENYSPAALQQAGQ